MAIGIGIVCGRHVYFSGYLDLRIFRWKPSKIRFPTIKFFLFLFCPDNQCYIACLLNSPSHKLVLLLDRHDQN